MLSTLKKFSFDPVYLILLIPFTMLAFFISSPIINHLNSQRMAESSQSFLVPQQSIKQVNLAIDKALLKINNETITADIEQTKDIRAEFVELALLGEYNDNIQSIHVTKYVDIFGNTKYQIKPIMLTAAN